MHLSLIQRCGEVTECNRHRNCVAIFAHHARSYSCEGAAPGHTLISSQRPDANANSFALFPRRLPMSRRFQAGCRPHRLTAAKPAGPAIALAVAGLVAGCSAGSNGAGPSAGGVIRPASVSAAQLALLPKATTFGSSKDAPTDPDPFKPETGIVLHPKATLAVYSRPGGPPVAALPDTELGSPTWVPVVQSLPGWDRILLPSRPNRS